MSRHITKEDYWKIKIGDKLMIRRDIDSSDNFDGNSFLTEMATMVLDLVEKCITTMKIDMNIQN